MTDKTDRPAFDAGAQRRLYVEDKRRAKRNGIIALGAFYLCLFIAGYFIWQFLR